MDGIHDAQREQINGDVRASVSDADGTHRPLMERDTQAVIRRVSWALTWAIPLVALIVGIVLTADGTTEVWTPVGDDTYDVTMLAVWPAGIALMAVGVLGATAAAIATALSTKR